MKNMKQIISIIGTVLVLGIGAFFTIENKEPSQPAKSSEQIEVTLERVVDGDTIIMHEGQERKRMRLLLIDTPESNTKKTGSAQPYGQEAKEFLTEYLKGKKLSIVYDPKHEKVDQYDRTLAYLYADGQLVEEVLLKEGLARLGYYDGDELYYEDLKQAQSSAERAQKNIWSIDGYVGKKGFNQATKGN